MQLQVGLISRAAVTRGKKPLPLLVEYIAGADPGFPIGGGANPPGGVPTYDCAKFCEKLHENEKILGRGGCTPGVPP